MTGQLKTRRRVVIFATVHLLISLGCDTTPGTPPEVWKPLGYDTVTVDLPGCATALPPVRASVECSADAIGETIDVKDVCRLLVALQDWVESAPESAPSVQPDEWAMVRAVCVYRSMAGVSPHAPAEVRMGPRPSFLTLYADVPNRSHRLVVRMSEQTGGFEFDVAPRKN